MSIPYSPQEALILNTLRSVDALAMEQMKLLLPQLSWSELFHAVDALSRRGDIILRRKGFDYELQGSPRVSAPDPAVDRTHHRGIPKQS